MKKTVSLILFCFLYIAAFAQTNSDSLAYQLQRKKINTMLAVRTQKFGQYDQSLTMHTGIFGFQTKKDIRRSNDILMDIVKTDDNIYKEIKILLEYRTFQQTQVQTHSKEAEESNVGFMMTINKLRDQADLLRADELKEQQQYEKMKRGFIIATILMLALILYLLTRNRKKGAV
jgi:Xaa-Pro aminopeptidase